ncbi:hypothetical protein FHT21_002253 [Pedobacter sp. SG908]|nr:hypothetical protein [Pedobacter sp. SG908]
MMKCYIGYHTIGPIRKHRLRYMNNCIVLTNGVAMGYDIVPIVRGIFLLPFWKRFADIVNRFGS